MTHLSNPKTIMIMIFYSLLTFFIGPYLVRPFIKESKTTSITEIDLLGFLVGFSISLILWVKFGKYYATKHTK
jgi:hypothetical protein